jgi:hypothetical protein
MMTLMENGGFPMWFIVAFGLVALGAAVYNAVRPERRRFELAKWMSKATLYSTFVGTFADLAAVFYNFTGHGRLPAPGVPLDNPVWPKVIFQGIAESTSPGIMGFTLLSLTALMLAVGVSRMPADAKE